MHQSDTIEVQGISEILLRSFKSQENNEKLKSKYLGWLNDKENTRLIGSKMLHETMLDEAYIEESFRRFSSRTCHGFFIYSKKAGEYIGTAKLDKINTESMTAEDGIMIGERRFKGKGYGYQTYDLILKYAFENLKLRKVAGGCNINNLGMQKIFERSGYTKEGRFRGVDWVKEEWSDNHYYGIYREEYRELQKKRQQRKRHLT